jgi:hypothetical protein
VILQGVQAITGRSWRAIAEVLNVPVATLIDLAERRVLISVVPHTPLRQLRRRGEHGLRCPVA